MRVGPASARQSFACLPLFRWPLAFLACAAALVGAPVKLRVLEFNVLYGGDPQSTPKGPGRS